ncbi:MAG: hypothetical protein AAFR76_10155 [Planctomycetota bacterium]
MIARTTMIAIAAGVACTSNAQLLNANFETPGVSTTFANWEQFGDPAIIQPSFDLFNGVNGLLMFGNFFEPFNTQGVFQTLTGVVTPGEEWEVAALVGEVSGDEIVGSNIGFVSIVFRDSAGVNLVDRAVEIDVNNVVTDQLTRFSQSLVAPLGSVDAQIVIGFQQPVITDGGALHYDDAELTNLSSGNEIPFYNGSFEESIFGRAVEGWFDFGNAIPNIFTAQAFENPPASDGDASVLMFGQFNGDPAGNTTGIFQAIPASAGESWTASADVYNDSTDPIGVGNTAFLSLVFRDAGGNVLSDNPAPAADSTTTFDVWLPVSSSATAPAGTETVEIVLGYNQAPAPDGIAGNEPTGLVRWDNANLEVGGPARLCADQNGDGMINPGDFNAWVLNFNGGNLLADTNQNGVNDPGDFNAWVLAFNQGMAGPTCNP